MNKKITISIATAVTAGACAAVLLMPHTITVKERISEPVQGVKMNATSIKTNLLESLTNPKQVTPEKKTNATYTGVTDEDGNYVNDGLLKNVISAETVYVDYKPTLSTASYKADGVNYFTTSFKAGEEPSVPDTTVLASAHPYENFKEWKKNEDQKLAETGDAAKSVTYEAVFEGKTYKITYDLDGGTAENPDTYKYGEGVESFNNASKSGYTFDGWYSDADKTQKVESIGKDEHDDKTLYAKFHENPKPVVRQTTNGSTRKYSASPVGGGSAGYSAPAASGPCFPYVGSLGAVTLSNGYSVALESMTAENVDRAYTAGFDESAGNEIALGPNGEDLGYVLNAYMYVCDHNYGVPAALPGIKNSNTMWLRHADGSVETLHKTYTFRTATQSLVSTDGRNFADGSLVRQYGKLVFRTCDESSDGGCFVTIWN